MDGRAEAEKGEMAAVAAEWRRIATELGPARRGLILAACVAGVARALHLLIPGPTLNKSISEIVVAVLLGLCLRNTLGVPAASEPGIRFALQRVLRLGIILLGLRLSVQDVAATGVAALALVVACIATALTVAHAAGRLFRIPPRLAVLIGVGTAICGNSAIVATAPVIGAEEDEVSFAVAVITLFGLLAVILYPVVGQFLGLSEGAFGMWAGTAVNDTSQVVAVGAAHSPGALNVATVVKLTRNTLMAPVIVLIGFLFRRKTTRGTPRVTAPGGSLIPLFVVGFLAMSIVRSLGIAAGVLPQNVSRPGDLQTAAAFLRYVDDAAKFAILTALAGVGLGTRIRSVMRIGLKPFTVGLCVAAVLSMVSLTLIVLAGTG